MNKDTRCAACLAPIAGTYHYSIHRDGLGVGPEVPLCDACGDPDGPTCEELWQRIKTQQSMPRVANQLLAFAEIALRFGQVRRVTQHQDGELESDSTHTVMLSLLVIEVAPLAGLDVGLAVQFATVHDLVETYALDTNTAGGLTDEQLAAKAEREAAALGRLSRELVGSRTIDILRRYEQQVEPEARLVRYLDKALPKLTHFLNGGVVLRQLGMTAADVRERHATQGAALAEQYPEQVAARAIFEAACALVEAGLVSGEVRCA